MDMGCICDPRAIERFASGGTNGREVKRVHRVRFARMALSKKIKLPELRMCLDRTFVFCGTTEFGKINAVFRAFRGLWGFYRNSLVVEAMFHLRSF